MKENIYTIPVLDGFKDNHECPFCSMKNKLERDTINFVLGPSYMEDDVRTETNKYGFCKEHIEKLYKEKNRLGLALMLHTHMMKTREEMEKLLEAHRPNSNSGLKKFFAKGSEGGTNPFHTFMEEKINGCYVCNRVNSIFDRYIDTFFFLLKKDPSMWEHLRASKGFCFEHFYQIYSIASQHLNQKQLDEFMDTIIDIQMSNLKRIEDDLEWFTVKFDHRFKDEPWKNSKDAIPRAMIKTNSIINE